jgi:hypothetical protein
MEASLTYYIYNSAVQPEVLFREPDDYIHFQKKANQFINSIGKLHLLELSATTFHFIIEFHSIQELKKTHPPHVKSTKLLSRKLADLFNSYAQSYNNKYGRKGALFQKNFHQVELENSSHFDEIISEIELV